MIFFWVPWLWTALIPGGVWVHALLFRYLIIHDEFFFCKLLNSVWQPSQPVLYLFIYLLTYFTPSCMPVLQPSRLASWGVQVFDAHCAYRTWIHTHTHTFTFFLSFFHDWLAFESETGTRIIQLIIVEKWVFQKFHPLHWAKSNKIWSFGWTFFLKISFLSFPFLSFSFLFFSFLPSSWQDMKLTQVWW